MKITLAFPYTDEKDKTHDPDSTIEVDDAVGRNLIYYGRARLPDDAKSQGDGADNRAYTKTTGQKAANKEDAA